MRILFFLFIVLSLPSWGQFDMPHSGENRSGTFWSLDFSNGIPSDWTSTTNNAPATWEYRGTATSPNINVGGRGSCETGVSGGLPIQSPTTENGFIIFDSNYWDNDANPCGTANFGTGQAPGPHVAILETSSFDLTEHPYPALKFYSALRDYQCSASVQMSINGGSWEAIYIDPFTNSGISANDELIQVPLTGAGGAADVRLRFAFEGLYYYWMIDDLELFDLLETDIAILSSGSTGFIPNDFTTFPSIPYKVYPDEMTPTLEPSALVRNNGGETQEGILLNASLVYLDDNIGVSGSVSLQSTILVPGEEATLTVPPMPSPSLIGDYELVLYTTQDSTDENLSNNRTVHEYAISESTWAVESGPITASYYPTDEYISVPYLIGNIFIPTASGMTLESISTTIANGTSTPSSFFGAVYIFHPEDGLSLVSVAQTSPMEITPSMINFFGEENLTTVTFSSPVALEEGESYFIAVGTNDGAEDVQFGVSSAAPAGASWLVFNNVAYLTIERAPMVRCNLGDLVSVKEKEPLQPTVSVFPNPSNGTVHWNLPVKEEPYTLNVYDVSGKKITSQNVGSVDQVDLSFLPKGYYNLTFTHNESHFHCQLILN